VAIDPERGINNGEPFLHAAWIGAVAPLELEVLHHLVDHDEQLVTARDSGPVVRGRDCHS